MPEMLIINDVDKMYGDYAISQEEAFVHIRQNISPKTHIILSNEEVEKLTKWLIERLVEKYG